jgi:hypothetical protein
MRRGNLFMAHRTGFSAKTLLATLYEAGFGKIAVISDPARFVLWAVATKATCDDETITNLARRHIPNFTGTINSASS